MVMRRAVYFLPLLLSFFILGFTVFASNADAGGKKHGKDRIELCHKDDDGGYIVIKVPMHTAMKHVLKHGDFEDFEVLEDGSCGPVVELPECLCAEFWNGGNDFGVMFPGDVGTELLESPLNNCVSTVGYHYGRGSELITTYISTHTANDSLFCTVASNGVGTYVELTPSDPLAEIQACIHYIEDVAVPETDLCTEADE